MNQRKFCVGETVILQNCHQNYRNKKAKIVDFHPDVNKYTISVEGFSYDHTASEHNLVKLSKLHKVLS